MRLNNITLIPTFLSRCSMSAPLDSSSSTRSSCPPVQARVRAVSWLESVSPSTSMAE